MNQVRLALLRVFILGLLCTATTYCQQPLVATPPDNQQSAVSMRPDSVKTDATSLSITVDTVKTAQGDSLKKTEAGSVQGSQVDSLKINQKIETAEVSDSGAVRTISGTITASNTQKNLAGVVVRLKEASTETASDENGKYSILVSSNKDVLLFSLNGYLPQEVLVEYKVLINIALDENVQMLEKMVVIGYGTTKKQEVTGSVSSIDLKEFQKSVGASVGQALQGKATGVQVTQNSGAPGKELTIRIRGVGTINKSDPLYIVDGQPVKSISYLNTDDIEAISVLKDASATAIYGSRGANGVILVSTKKGKTDKAEINYSGSVGWQNPIKEPDLCSAEEWAILNNEAYRAANQPIQIGLENPASLGKGTDWFDEVVNRNALIQDHNVSVSRGMENLKYFLSLGYFSQDGILRGSDYRKMSMRLNTENKVYDWLSIGNNIGFANIQRNNADESDEWNSLISSALSIDPVSKPRDSNGNLVSSRYTQVKNPVGIVEHTFDTDKNNILIGDIYADIKLGNLITYNSDFGIDLEYLDKYQFKPAYDLGPGDNVELSTVYRENARNFNWNWENTASIQGTLGEGNNVKLTLGSTMDKIRDEIMTAENQGTPNGDQSFHWLNATMETNGIVSGVGNPSALLSYLGRLNYDYAGKYLLAGTMRSDGSSRFDVRHRWGWFPSVTGGWRISQEPFMEKVVFVKELKLRGGWGKTGNQDIGNFMYITKTTNGENYVFNGEVFNGTTLTTAGNSDIEWEAQISYNVGLDAELFKGKVEFVADYFNKKTVGMLTQPTIPGCVGLDTSPMVNAGDVENKGFEFLLAYKGKVKAFSTSLSLNFSTYDNIVLKLGTRDEPIVDVPVRDKEPIVRTEVGHPIGSFYGYKTDGLFQNWEAVNSYKDKKGNLIQPNARPGDIRYVDENRDGELDKDYIGDPTPDFTFGFNAEFTWKDWDLGMFFQGSYGNDLFNAVRYTTDNNTAQFNLDRRMLNRWTGEGTTNDANLARMNINGSDNLRVSDRYVEDGSYLRLKTLQLGYSLPKSVVEKLHISKFRIYIGAQNLFTLTRYSGLDPEIGLGEDKSLATKNRYLDMGIDRGTYPQARTIIAGINISL